MKQGLFLAFAVFASLLASTYLSAADNTGAGSSNARASLFHETDLFRPCNDPDDHWDLTCLYALSHEKRLNLNGVLIDFPPRMEFRPDTGAIKQMNLITGQDVPFAIGSSRGPENNPQPSPPDLAGVQAIAESLKNAPHGLFIDICGSCRDVAMAIRQYPELFRKKCRGIYLNAGRGDRRPSNQPLEYNVTLDPKSYSTIFQAPCPVYWMPCFGPEGYGTFYTFKQGDILPFLSADVRRFFISMLTKDTTTDWTTVLKQDPNPAALADQNQSPRNMWCTGEFFHVAGLGVDSQGTIKPLAELGKDSVYEFEPIQVKCNEKGEVEWDPEPKSTNRFIFHMLNQDHYSTAMTQAMKTLLQGLP